MAESMAFLLALTENHMKYDSTQTLTDALASVNADLTRIPQLTLGTVQTWNSEDTRLYSFTVFFGPWQPLLWKLAT
jgi:hypothetical protein